jgi:hypothetical protein
MTFCSGWQALMRWSGASLAVLTGNMGQLLQHVFGLLGRLSEVRVLQHRYNISITLVK